jgi:hypothetical protein
MKLTKEQKEAGWPDSWKELQRRWINRDNNCFCCKDNSLGPIVHDWLWIKIAPYTKTVLCLKCMETSLGRKITRSDCKQLLWNELRWEILEV